MVVWRGMEKNYYHHHHHPCFSLSPFSFASYFILGLRLLPLFSFHYERTKMKSSERKYIKQSPSFVLSPAENLFFFSLLSLYDAFKTHFDTKVGGGHHQLAHTIYFPKREE
jgi:hypothetical protein